MTLLDPVAPADTTPPTQTLCAPRLLAGVRPDRPTSHAEHLALTGPLRHRSHAWLVEAATAVRLLGRGGAAFPVAAKLASIAPGRHVEAVVNGSESDPTSFKDRVLLRRAPHRVLDGAVLVAAALGTDRVTVAVHDPDAARALAVACQERGDAGFVRLVRTGEGFVAGEIRALVNGLGGRPAVPGGRRTPPSAHGVGGRPTFAANVETFAQLALLGALGPQEYASVGSATEPGTSLVTLFGDVPWAGVAEVPNGHPLDALTGRAAPSRPVLMGGYHGTWSAAPGLVVDRGALAARGLSWGAGVLVVLPDSTCPIGELAAVAQWLAHESVGQCGPCVFGLASIARDVARLSRGEPVDVADLRRRLGLVDGRGACGHPSGAVRFLATGLAAHQDDLGRHAVGSGCGRPVIGALPVPGTLG